MQQITIWDLVENKERDINILSEAEMVTVVNRECGLNLSYDKFFADYRQKMKHGWVISIEYSNYFSDDDEMMNDRASGERFIGLDIMSAHGGFATSCDSIDECVEYINSWVERQKMK